MKMILCAYKMNMDVFKMGSSGVSVGMTKPPPAYGGNDG